MPRRAASETEDATPPTSAETVASVHLIINARSGAARHAQLGERARAYLQTRGIDTHVDLVHSGPQLHRVLERSGNGDHDVVIAAGGDGTISTVASAVVDSGRVLGILPVGTFNYFAQRLGVPLDIDQALGVIAGVFLIQNLLWVAQRRCSSEDLSYWEGLLIAAASTTTGFAPVSLALSFCVLLFTVCGSFVFALTHDGTRAARHAGIRFGKLVIAIYRLRLYR
jgi:hypothetical protein